MIILSAQEFCGGYWYRCESRGRHKGTFTHRKTNLQHMQALGLISFKWSVMKPSPFNWGKFLKTVDFEVYSSRNQEKSGFEKRLVVRSIPPRSVSVALPSFGSIAFLLSAPCSRKLVKTRRENTKQYNFWVLLRTHGAAQTGAKLLGI